MRTVLLGPPAPPIEEWLERRRALGQDRYDEVWEGDYHVAPEVHGRHGDIQSQLAEILGPRARAAGLWGSGPRNLGTPSNYRVPDSAYARTRRNETYNATAAIAVEILSPGDESYAKFGFYAELGFEEILVVDPLTHGVEWYRCRACGADRSWRSDLLDLTEVDLAARLDWPD